MDGPAFFVSLSSLTHLTSFCLFTIFITLFSHHPLLRFLVCQWPSMTCTDTLFLRAFRHKLMSLPGTNTEIKQTLHPCCLVHSPIIKHLGDCKFPLWCSCSSHPFSPCPVSFWVLLRLFTNFWKHGHVCGQSLSGVQLIMILRTIAHQPPLSMEFSRQECRVGCHSLHQSIFLTQGLNRGLLLCRQILCHWATWEFLNA